VLFSFINRNGEDGRIRMYMNNRQQNDVWNMEYYIDVQAVCSCYLVVSMYDILQLCLSLTHAHSHLHKQYPAGDCYCCSPRLCLLYSQIILWEFVKYRSYHGRF
jgi:hypothetical protein